MREKHGMSKTKIYRVWCGIISRTNYKGDTNYKRYGGRGLSVCDKWRKFSGFYEDMGSGYVEGLEIDRVDNGLGYSRKNCRWATRKDQANNKKSNHLITWRGKTKTMKQWSETVGINYGTLKCRINRYKLSINEAMTRPTRGV